MSHGKRRWKSREGDWESQREDCVTKKVTSEQGSEGNEGLSHIAIWGKHIPGREKNRCKGHGAGMCALCWSNSQEADKAVQGLGVLVRTLAYTGDSEQRSGVIRFGFKSIILATTRRINCRGQDVKGVIKGSGPQKTGLAVIFLNGYCFQA